MVQTPLQKSTARASSHLLQGTRGPPQTLMEDWPLLEELLWVVLAGLLLPPCHSPQAGQDRDSHQKGTCILIQCFGWAGCPQEA
jgi:hypothetical protein